MKLMKKTTKTILTVTGVLATAITLGIWDSNTSFVEASSHREAPLIANDPLADNTDLYAFRCPDDSTHIAIIANYVPLQLPQGGPNFASFGENIRYEIHVKNNAATTGDDITYRFTFSKVNEDPTTFFNIRLGMENLKTTYMVEKKIGAGAFATIVTSGVVPPPNIGPKSISGGAGLGVAAYDNLIFPAAISTATGGGGETIFCGPADDPFFADLGGIFDLGHTRDGLGPKDGVGHKNVHSIAMKIPISTLQKTGLAVTSATSILDPNFVIGVWASASRQTTRTLSTSGSNPTDAGAWVQVSRLGMPLTNEAVIAIGQKDRWNSASPYVLDTTFDNFAMNPELALYMDPTAFASAVPEFNALRIQSASHTVLGDVNFRNGQDGLYAIYGHPATNGTALDTSSAGFGKYLLRNNKPRSVDLLPIFHTGVPNLIPYQLATGKTDGNPLTAGKPFINNFLPTFGDMLRLNMAVPATPRNSADFSSLGLVQAAVLGLTDPRFNTTTTLQRIPNMDGFPNGRRLEDDVTRIELQAVSGVVLAAIGLWYDDRPIGSSPLSTDLTNVLGYKTGVQANDTTFRAIFPYVQTPWSGYANHSGQ
jgi:hypothetical protein